MQKTRRGKHYIAGGANIHKLQNAMVCIEKSKCSEEWLEQQLKEKVEESKKEKESDEIKENETQTDEGKNKKKLEEKSEQKSEISEDKCKKESSENDKNKEEKEEKTETNVNEETLTGQKEDEEEKETNDDITQSEGCHIETMLGYINDGENYVSAEESQKRFEGNMVTQMLFKGETDSEKEERMAVIGQSLIISHLEDDLEEILKTKIAVKDTEDRIYQLQQVIQLLKGFEIKKKHDTKRSSSEKGLKRRRKSEGREKCQRK